jgi:hypothetical protein
MAYWLIKTLLSGMIIATVSEIAKRNPGFGALIVSLPLLSILGMVWMWQDDVPPDQIATHAEATFWLVLPSLPMFLTLPFMLRAGMGFWPSLAFSCVLTIGLYALSVWLLPKFGIASV